MDAERFDAAARLVGRRGLLRGLAALALALPAALRARAAGAQAFGGYCAPTGRVCVAGIACCDGTACPLNVSGFIGLCVGSGAAPPTGGDGDGDPREPNDGEALPRRAKRKKRKENRKAYRHRRRRGFLKGR